MKKPLTFVLLSFLIITLNGCAMKWNQSWHGDTENQPTSRSRQFSAEARKIFLAADDEEKLRASIAAFEKIIAENPGDYYGLKMLSTQHILLGTAYTENRLEKSKYFHQAMVYAERAMYTNDRFRAMINNGIKPWEAVSALTADEVEAMFFWVTALQYEFKEGMTLPAKIINIDWLHRALLFLDRIEEVDPQFGEGGVEFAKVICYYALPKSKGGSRSKGDAYMQRAVERGERRLLPRWARGKYYYPIKGEADKSHQDLEWVASRNLEDFEDLYPWRVHFQEDARLLR